MATIKVRRLLDPAELKRDITFSTADLDDAMMQQASFAVHYGQLAAAAAKQLDDLKLVLEVQEARIDRNIRDEAAKEGAGEDGKKKLTEAQIAKMVSVHDSVISVKKAINEAKQIESEAKTAVEAFKQRRDMLVQIGAGERIERQGELVIRRSAAAEADRNATAKRVSQMATGNA